VDLPGGLAAFFSLLDQRAGSLRGLLGLGGRISPDMNEWGNQGNLNPYLFTAQSWCGRQGCDLMESAG
jgi:hypothetical protein